MVRNWLGRKLGSLANRLLRSTNRERLDVGIGAQSSRQR